MDDLTFEYELDALIFSHIRPAINNILADKKLRRELALSAKDKDGKLGLRNMAISLGEAGKKDSHRVLPVRRFIDALHVPDDDKKFLYATLPPYLIDVAEIRTFPDHRHEKEGLLDEISRLRCKALGIGEQSYLRRLLRLKRAVRHKASD